MDSIDQFIDSYWQPPIDPGVTKETYMCYLDSLKEKHDTDIIDQYIKESNKGGTQKIFDVIFENDLLNDVFPNAALRARKTLKSVLSHLSQKSEPFTLLDLGSGDGMITIGLSAFLDNLKKVYAIDLCPYAMPLLEKNLGKLPAQYRNIAESKLELYTGNFNCHEDLKMIPEDIDVGLIAYPYDFDGAVYSFSSIAKKGSEMIVSVDGMLIDDKFDEDDYYHLSFGPLSEINRSFQHSGIYFNYLDHGVVEMKPKSLFIVANALI